MEDKKKANGPFDSAEELTSAIERYFGEYLNESGEIADIESLADYLGTTRDEILIMLYDKAVGKILRSARNRIAKIKKQLAFNGKIPSSVLTFDLKNNHGYKDKPEETEATSQQTVIFKGKATQWAK